MRTSATRRREAVGNVLIIVLALMAVVAYGVDMANRTEARLQARAERSAR